MPTELQIIRAREFIRLGAQGHFDLEASKAALKQLAAACGKRGIHQALLDVRTVVPGEKPVFTPKDLVTLVNTFAKAGFTPQDRLAVLYCSDPRRRARMFSFIATAQGWKVEVFHDFEKAVFWLSAGVPEACPQEETATSRPRKVSIRKFKPLPAASKPVAQPVIKIKVAPAQRGAG
jgi:hypothetical protein